jgi:type II secretory pathway pseudopilin PulG
MIVVLAITAILGTLMAVSFAAVGRRASREGAAEDAMGLLRQAQTSAIDSGRGAMVRVDPAGRTLYGLSSTIEAAWHLEQAYAAGGDSELVGSRGMKATITFQNPPPAPTDMSARGAVGLGLAFTYDDNATPADLTDDTWQYLNCGNLPVYDQTDGIRIEAYARPAAGAAGDEAIMAKTDGATLGYSLGIDYADVDGDGQLDVWADAGFAVQGALIYLSSYNTVAGEGVTFAPSEWVHLAAEFDGFEARLYVDGVLVDLDSYRDNEANPTDGTYDHQPNRVVDPNGATDVSFNFSPDAAPQLTRILPARNEPLLIGARGPHAGGPDAYFTGDLDEPMILSIAGGDRIRLPERVSVVASEEVIHFDGQGHLDIAYHSGPAYVGLGDPYQAAPLQGDLAAGDSTYLYLGAPNPFPRGEGSMLVGGELIHYLSGDETSLNIAPSGRGAFGTYDQWHPSGQEAHYARVLSVSLTGVVRRED